MDGRDEKRDREREKRLCRSLWKLEEREAGGARVGDTSRRVLAGVVREEEAAKGGQE